MFTSKQSKPIDSKQSKRGVNLYAIMNRIRVNMVNILNPKLYVSKLSTSPDCEMETSECILRVLSDGNTIGSCTFIMLIMLIILNLHY